MSAWQKIPLEDEFGDNLRKAMLGTGTDAARLGRATGLPPEQIAAWTAYDGRPDEATARALATVLHLDPQRMADSAADRWYPPEIAPSQVRRHFQKPHPSNGYVFFHEDRGAALIDPAGDPTNLLRVLHEGAYDLQYLLITHKHADHCDATAAVSTAFPNAKIVMHATDAPAIGRLASRALNVADGQTLPFGDATIRVLHTPGHTDGSMCFSIDTTVFTGDTLFAGSVGGAFGHASTYADILQGIRTRLFALPGDTAVMPGHGPPTTIALEKRHNPFFP
ncbi:MAG TPA: MBL fold metallo-hydrolase [Candidatus Baltobacteraceae bacterium]